VWKTTLISPEILIFYFLVFNCHFFSNFITIFLDDLLPLSLSHSASPLLSSSSSKYLKMAVLSISALLPHFLVILSTWGLEKNGLYALIRFLFALKILFSIFGYWLGKSLFHIHELSTDVYSLLFLLVYMVLAKSFNEVICRHGNLVLADIVDEDTYLHDRATSISSLIFGVNAFFTKPGQSLAPAFGWKMISLFSPATSSSTSSLGIEPMTIFLFLVLVPIICGTLQSFVWSFFSLHTRYLEVVKNTRKMV
jgi:hypothetical protein